MISDAQRTTWQRLLAEQQASGMSVTAWCFQQDIREQTFYNWRKRLAATAPTPQWVALAPTSVSGQGLTLQVGPVAITVTAGFDPHLLADVVRALTAPC
jgi:hypothetical protein